MDQIWRLQRNNELQQQYGESGILTHIIKGQNGTNTMGRSLSKDERGKNA